MLKNTLSISLFTLSLASCSSTLNHGSAHPYTFHQQAFEAANFKRVIIADLNFGAPSKSYLRDRQEYIDNKVADYLSEHGYEVVSNDIFKTYWQQNITGKSSLIDKYTGAKNQRVFAEVLLSTLEKIQQNNHADAVIFTDLVSLETQFSPFGRHHTQFDGVMRKPEMQGTGSEGISANFNWYTTVDAVSLSVNWVDTDGKILFSSKGGIEVTQKIDARTSDRWVRSKKILKNDRFINEGIELAFHPVIKMKNYPGFESRN